MYTTSSSVFTFQLLRSSFDHLPLLVVSPDADVYLVGTVMLIFGMGLYELFVSSLNVNGASGDVGEERRHNTACGSNFFGLFRLSVQRAAGGGQGWGGGAVIMH